MEEGGVTVDTFGNRLKKKKDSLQIEGSLKMWWQTAGGRGAQDGLVWNCVCEDDVCDMPGVV